MCPQPVSDLYNPPIRVRVPPGHVHSDTAELGRPLCLVSARIFGIPITSVEMNQTYPEWVPVRLPPQDPIVTLVGTVQGYYNEQGKSEWPHIAYEDWPLTHLTHDFTFHVRPDPGYDYLNGWQVPQRLVDPCPRLRARYWLAIFSHEPTGAIERQLLNQECWWRRVFEPTHKRQQPDLEVEWESGVGASNDGNPCTHANDYIGNSCGLYSAGHTRRSLIWNWPTVGDHVTVIGNWIWDRGHPPALTEIHPPRMVAVQRRLPAFVTTDPDQPAVVSTRADVFASGDESALLNNRGGFRLNFIQRVRMADRDYSFDIAQPLPPPSPSAQLRWLVVRHPGDTFPGDPTIAPATIGGQPGVHVTIPWRSIAAPDPATFARTVYLYWAEARGVALDYHYRVYRVTLDHIRIVDSHDHGDGEYRVLVGVGSEYLFLNEVTRDPHDILSDGLGDTGSGENWGIVNRVLPGAPHYAFNVILPVGDPVGFRVHASGWEADGVNDAYGDLLDPNHPLDDGLIDALNRKLFRLIFALSGCNDDPIGEVNNVSTAAELPPGFSGDPPATAEGPIVEDKDGCSSTRENFSYRLFYHVQETYSQ